MRLETYSADAMVVISLSWQAGVWLRVGGDPEVGAGYGRRGPLPHSQQWCLTLEDSFGGKKMHQMFMTCISCLFMLCSTNGMCFSLNSGEMLFKRFINPSQDRQRETRYKSK